MILSSGGFRGYAAAYPIDWTGCIFVIFNFCPIFWNWIFGHQLIPCMAAWVQKQNTDHALMTEADTDRSLQRSRPWDSYLESSNADQPVCNPCSATGGGNVSGVHRRQSRQAEFELWKQRWHAAAEPPKDCTAYIACNAPLYGNLSILLQVLVTLPLTTATPERSFSTLKRLKTYLRNLPSSMEDEWLRSLALLACSTYMRKRRQSNLSKSLTSSLYWTTQA